MTLQKNIRRFDRGELAKPVRMANGWLRVDGFIARSGLLEYQRADGSSWVEYRPEEETFHADMLDSFTALPLTDDHPPEGYLDAANTSRYQVGTIAGTPSRHEDKVRAQMLVTDAGVIAKMVAGKAELSCGYLCDLELEPGEIDGKRYDAVQRNVRGNHVALVKAGRAGPEIRVRLDTANAEVLVSQTSQSTREPMSKLKIAGVEYEVAEPAAQAFAQFEKAQGEIVAGVTAECEKQKARADAAEASLAAAPAKIKAELVARVDLETRARAVLGAEEAFEGKSDLEIQRAVAEKALGLKMDGKPDAYVAACFDLALVKAAESGSDALAVARAATAPVHVDAADSESAYQKFLAASRNAHKTPSK